MGAPATSGQFGDLLDPRFQKIFNDILSQYKDMIPTLYGDQPTNGRNDIRWSEVGTMPDFQPFTGSIPYQSVSQGYDVVSVPLEFASGFQVERKLYDDDQYHIMDQRPKGLATSAVRTRQKHAARIFNMAFSVDNYFYNHSEGVALCSDSHTTTSGASTSTGFDNLITASLSPVAVAAARIQFVNFRGDQGEIISSMPDEIWYPPNLYEVAQEIVGAMGKVDTALNNPNVHHNAYTLHEWNYMMDTNNWFMCDSSLRKQSLYWIDRIPLEFAYVEDFDTMVAKWRAYMRHSTAYLTWRWIIGANVS